jgi:sulfonate transport system substrate-binding protein
MSSPCPASVIADQQKLADTFFDLKLIPKAIAVSDAAYKRGFP